jgi:hypothetical protein
MSPTKRGTGIEGIRRGVGQAPGPVPGTAVPEPVQVLQRPRREKPVRFTLDLDRDRHQFLKQYATGIEADASEVVRALLDQLRADDVLADRVRARVWEPRA